MLINNDLTLIKYPIVTEKSFNQIKNNKYTFNVNRKLTKPQIKKLFEQFFNVKIIAINTHILPIKKKRIGFKKSYKRVIIQIQKDQKIDIFDKMMN